MDSQFHKALSVVSASLVIGVSPSYATSPSQAQLYGQIDKLGNLEAGSVGIYSSGGKVGHPSPGYYCIKPTSTTLQTAVTNGTVGVQLTQRSLTGTAIGLFVVQLYGSNKAHHCASNEIAVTVVHELRGLCTAPGPTNPSVSATGPSYCGYESYDSDFTVMFE